MHPTLASDKIVNWFDSETRERGFALKTMRKSRAGLAMLLEEAVNPKSSTKLRSVATKVNRIASFIAEDIHYAVRGLYHEGEPGLTSEASKTVHAIANRVYEEILKASSDTFTGDLSPITVWLRASSDAVNECILYLEYNNFEPRGAWSSDFSDEYISSDYSGDSE